MANLRSSAMSRIKGNMAKGKGRGLGNNLPAPQPIRGFNKPRPIRDPAGYNDGSPPKAPRGVQPITKVPKPFQPGFTAGRSGKVPPGLAKAAANRLARRGQGRGINLKRAK